MPFTNHHFKKINIATAAVVVILLVIFFIGLFSLGPAIDAYYYAQNGKNALFYAQNSLQKQDLSKTSNALNFSYQNFEKAQNSFKKLSWLRAIPYISIQYKASYYLLSCVTNTTSSLVTVTNTAENILGAVKLKDLKNIGGLDKNQKREILRNLYQSTPIIYRAKSQIELAEIEINKIPKFGVISPIKKYKNQLTSNFPKIKDTIENIYLAAKILPDLGGYPKEKSYFLMFQNNTELRPTGGFFGTYGIITVKDGEIKRIITNDPYNLDNRSKIYVTPPWQLPTLSNPQTKSWYLRDANWYPDFPATVEKILWFYKEEGGKGNFDGVISITPTVIEYLLEVTGPVSVKDFPKEFTSENVTDLIQYHVEKRFTELGLKEESRKNLIGELAQVLLKRIFDLPKDKIEELVKVLDKSLLEKQIFLYSKNQDAQKFIEEQNWTGKINKNPNSDFVFVVDSNMASLKTDEYVKRSFDYQIDLTQDQASAVLKLTYKNNATGFTWKTTRYRNWNRIYVPYGSELTKIYGNEEKKEYYDALEQNYEKIDEFGKTSFGTFISIEPGDQKTLTYEYKLPKNLTKKLKNQYALYFQKQGGVIKPDLKVGVIFDKKIKSFFPDFGRKIDDKKIEYIWDLNQDREVNLKF